ncbi:MAG TPA: hypothetical protein DCZ71_02455 [Ruminococcus sp.]|nr:hypothetical protein [Ruminococcus sp.]
MNNITKKIIAIGALLAIAMTSVTGCGSVKRHSSSSSEAVAATDEAPMLQMPLDFIDPEEDSDNPLEEYGIDPEADDPVADSTEVAYQNATEVVKETDENGQPVTEIQEVTEIQPVTEADGQPATDEKGNQRTEVVKATVIVEKTKIVNVTDNKGQVVTEAVKNTVTTAAANNDYTPKTKQNYAMWLDISNDENFFFEGEFLKYTFKIKEGIPDGDYKIRITPDFSDVTGKSVYPSKTIDGTIRVNNGSVDKIDVGSETGFTVYGTNAACKQGDTVDFYVNVKNNTGIVAFVMKIYYDGNAMELTNYSAAGDFEEISSRSTEFGEAKLSE